LWSFFLKAVFGDDPFHAAGADRPADLPQLLRYDIWGGVAVEEAVPDYLPDDFGGSAVSRLGAAFLAFQCDCAGFLEERAELKVALFAETEFGCGLEWPRGSAFSFHEHQQLACDLVVFGHDQAAAGPDQRVVIQIELRHFCVLRKAVRVLSPSGGSIWQRIIAETA
jgi:hypothetical protein